jgi:hypothetical protein
MNERKRITAQNLIRLFLFGNIQLYQLLLFEDPTKQSKTEQGPTNNDTPGRGASGDQISKQKQIRHVGVLMANHKTGSKKIECLSVIRTRWGVNHA